eukprot:2755510-Amphidinium_carterae.2
MDRLGIRRGSAAKAKAMPAIAMAMPQRGASGAASSQKYLENLMLTRSWMETADVIVPDDNQEDNEDNGDAYHLGMLGGDETWSEEWVSAKGDLRRAGDSGTALPGGSPPGLSNPGQRPVQAKDAVHEVEWDGQRWIASDCCSSPDQQIGDVQCFQVGKHLDDLWHCTSLCGWTVRGWS